MRIAELQGQVGLRRELLVLRAALIVLEAIDDIGADVGKIGAVEGDRRHPALILVRSEVDACRSQCAGAQYLLDEIIAFIAPIILDARVDLRPVAAPVRLRSEEHTSELQSLMRTSYAVFCLKKKNKI